MMSSFYSEEIMYFSSVLHSSKQKLPIVRIASPGKAILYGIQYTTCPYGKKKPNKNIAREIPVSSESGNPKRTLKNFGMSGKSHISHQ